MTPARTPADLGRLSHRLGGSLRVFAEVRRGRGLTSDELLIFLAIGHLGLDGHGAVTRLVPRTHSEIADFTGVPRETVRRKIGRLCDLGLTEATSRGVVVCDVDQWSRVAEAMFSTSGEARTASLPEAERATVRPVVL